MSHSVAPHLFAAIHIGSEQVSMQIVEFTNLENMRTIERTQKDVSFGEEAFKTGRISYETTTRLCELLQGYRRMLQEYSVDEFRVIATTAIREAENQHYIVDQIRIRTGFEIEVSDMIQEIFFKYAALFNSMQRSGLTNTDQSLLFVDISSGGLGFTLLRDGIIEYQQNVHIGALRIKESFDKNQRESAHFQQALSEYIFSSIEPVKEELSRHSIKYIITSGNVNHLVLQMLGRAANGPISLIERDEFFSLHEKVQGLNLPQLMKAFRLNESRAEMVLPTIVLYHQILSMTNATEMVFPDVQLVDGVTSLHIATKISDPLDATLEAQIISLARTTGKKYCYDTAHSGAVEELSLQIFDAMASMLGMGRRHRLILQVAAILHDIGKFVSLRRHYFYSYRLILSSDILGFTEREKEVVANVAHYHSKGVPSNADANFARLERTDKITVAKLAAMIRLADAVDRSHLQKSSCHILLKELFLEIHVAPNVDFSLEEWTFVDKADFFEEVHGIRPVLINDGGGLHAV